MLVLDRHRAARRTLVGVITLALGSLSTVAAAQSIDTTAVAATAAPMPAMVHASNSVTRWEYARFTYNVGGGGYSWVTGSERSGDGSYRKFLAQLGLLGLLDHPSAELALLDVFGAQGWELVTCQTARIPGLLTESDVTACYFKRLSRTEAAPNSAP